MLKYLRKLLGLKKLEDDITTLKAQVDQLMEMSEAALTRNTPRDTDKRGGWEDADKPKKELHSGS